jgi:hypothetical protein
MVMNGEDTGIMEETAVADVCPQELNIFAKCLIFSWVPVQELNPEPAECETALVLFLCSSPSCW